MSTSKKQRQLFTLLVKLGNKFHNSADELFNQVEEFLMENPENHNFYDLLNYLAYELSIVKDEFTKNNTNLDDYLGMYTYTCVQALSIGVRMEDISNLEKNFEIRVIGDSNSDQEPDEDQDLKYLLLLLIASLIGSTRLAKLSLSKVQDNNFTKSALITAIANDDGNFTKFLKSEVDIPNEVILSIALDSVHAYCSEGLIEDVKMWLENEYVKNIEGLLDDVDMLLWAAFSGNIELIRYLFNYGFNSALQMEYAIVMAAKENYLDIIKFLHEQGANIHFNNDEAVQVAYEYNNSAIVSYLCQNGGKIRLDPNNFDVVKFIGLSK